MYHDLAEAFSRSKATKLPPHRSYDCAIDFLPNATPPKGRCLSSVPARDRGHAENISRKSSPKVSSVHPRLLHLLGSFSSRKIGWRTPFHVLTTERSTTYRQVSLSPTPGTSCSGTNFAKQDLHQADLRSAYNLVVSARGMSGKTAFLYVYGHYGISGHCLLGFPSILQCSNHSIMMSSRDMLNRQVGRLH